MPTKNSERFIRRAIDSLKKQTEPYELLVCDAGSTDKTLEILKGYGITPISFKDRNWSDGVNIGIKNAKGDIILQLMSDDELLDGAFKTIRDFYDKYNPEWTYCPCDLVGMNMTMGTDPDVTWEKMIPGNKLPGMAVQFRPSFFEKYGLFDVDEFPIAADYELWLRAMSFGAKPVQIPEKTIIFHYHVDNNGCRPEGAIECENIKKKYANKRPS